MRNIQVPFIILSLFLVGFVHAETRTSLRDVREMVEKRIEERKEIRPTAIEMKKNLIERAKEMVKKQIKRQVKGTLTTIADTTLTVETEKDDNYTVHVNENTQYKRKFGGESKLSDFKPNDSVLVIGKETGDKEMEAAYIRNLSIQRRRAVFLGEVTSKSTDSFTLKTTGRGTQTVYISSTTKFTEKNDGITFSDITLGNKVVVKGEVWDRESAKIDALTVMKLTQKQVKVTPTPDQEEE